MEFSNESIAAAALCVSAVVIGNVYLWCSRDDTKRQLSTIRQHCHELERKLNPLRAANQRLKTQLSEQKTRYNSTREAWTTSLRIIDRHEATERRHRQEIKRLQEEIKRLRQEIKRLQEENKRLREENKRLREEIKRLREELEISQESSEQSPFDHETKGDNVFDNASVHTQARPPELSIVTAERDKLMEMVIDWQLSEPAGTIVLSEEKPPIRIRVKDLETLQPGQWVNDEIINGYLALLLIRQMSGSEKLRVLFMNTFFYTKLTEINKKNPDGYNYKEVKRWTKPSRLASGGLPGAQNIFEADKVIIPVNLNNTHWTCVCVNMKEKRIEYYDSLYNLSRGGNVLENIEKYLQDEYEDKMRIKVEDSEGDESEIEWELRSYDEDRPDELRYPQQENYCDCGVFMLQCCKALCDDVFPSFLQQRSMPMLRKRMMCHIICGGIPS